MKFNVIGAGLAGVEAAWQIAERGYRVTLLSRSRIKNPLRINRIILQSLFALILLRQAGLIRLQVF